MLVYVVKLVALLPVGVGDGVGVSVALAVVASEPLRCALVHCNRANVKRIDVNVGSCGKVRSMIAVKDKPSSDLAVTSTRRRKDGMGREGKQENEEVHDGY